MPERGAAGGSVRLAAALLVACGLGLFACTDGPGKLEKEAGSAIWINGRSSFDDEVLADLRSVGIEEVFLESARIRRDGTVEDVPLPQLQPGQPVTLAVTGALEGLDVTVLASAWRQLRFAAESHGGLVIGLHLDLDESGESKATGPTLELYGERLEELRELVDRQLFLSVSLPPRWLRLAEVEGVAREVDFTVPLLYGQRPGEPEQEDSWQLAAVEEGLERMEELGRPYLLGVTTLGVATQMRETEVVDHSTEISLLELFSDRHLELVRGFSLEGGDRRTYQFQALAPTQVAAFALRRGDRVRATGLATADLETLLRVLDRRGGEHHLGQLYFRLPGSAERLSLSAANFLAAHRPSPATPELTVSAELVRRVPGGFRVRVNLANDSAEATAYSTLDRNFVELRVPRGEVDDRADAGEFQRYDVGHRDNDGTFVRSLRRPDTLRLFLPLLDGGQSASSGEVVVRQAGIPTLELRSAFLLPDGRLHEIGPLTWRDGEVVMPAADPGAEPSP